MALLRATTLILVAAFAIGFISATDLTSSSSIVQGQYEDVLSFAVSAEAFVQSKGLLVNSPLSYVSTIGHGANVTVVKLSTADLTSNGFSIFEISIPAGGYFLTKATELLLIYRNFSTVANPFTFGSSSSLPLYSAVVGVQIYPYPYTSFSTSYLPDLPSALFFSVPLGSSIQAEFSFASAPTSPVCALITSSGAPDFALASTAASASSVECSSSYNGDFAVFIGNLTTSSPPVSAPPAASPPSATTASTPPSSSNNIGGSSGLKGWQIALIVIAAVILLILVVLIYLCVDFAAIFGKRKDMERRAEQSEDIGSSNVAGPQRTPTAIVGE